MFRKTDQSVECQNTFGKHSQWVVCHKCKRSVKTVRRIKYKSQAHVFASILCALGLCFCSWIPYICNRYKMVYHHCPFCTTCLGYYDMSLKKTYKTSPNWNNENASTKSSIKNSPNTLSIPSKSATVKVSKKNKNNYEKISNFSDVLSKPPSKSSKYSNKIKKQLESQQNVFEKLEKMQDVYRTEEKILPFNVIQEIIHGAGDYSTKYDSENQTMDLVRKKELVDYCLTKIEALFNEHLDKLLKIQTRLSDKNVWLNFNLKSRSNPQSTDECLNKVNTDGRQKDVSDHSSSTKKHVGIKNKFKLHRTDGSYYSDSELEVQILKRKKLRLKKPNTSNNSLYELFRVTDHLINNFYLINKEYFLETNSEIEQNLVNQIVNKFAHDNKYAKILNESNLHNLEQLISQRVHFNLQCKRHELLNNINSYTHLKLNSKVDKLENKNKLINIGIETDCTSEPNEVESQEISENTNLSHGDIRKCDLKRKFSLQRSKHDLLKPNLTKVFKDKCQPLLKSPLSKANWEKLLLINESTIEETNENKSLFSPTVMMIFPKMIRSRRLRNVRKYRHCRPNSSTVIILEVNEILASDSCEQNTIMNNKFFCNDKQFENV